MCNFYYFTILFHVLFTEFQSVSVLLVTDENVANSYLSSIVYLNINSHDKMEIRTHSHAL